MPRFKNFAFALSIGALCFLSLSSASAAPTAAEDEKTLLQIERDACNAYLHGDADFLDKLLSDDFHLTDGSGAEHGKAAELADVRKKEITYTAFENRDMKVRLYGDTALIFGRTVSTGSTPGGATYTLEERFTDIFARLNGKWRAVASHVSSITPKEK